jgi:2-iminoacetate synthase
MSFAEHLEGADVRALRARVEAASRARVESALAREQPTFSDFLALLGPSARERLEPMAERARAVTLRRFGRVVQLYAPLYLSNACTNPCLYCGFRAPNPIPRVTLSLPEVIAEAAVLRGAGFRHLLLVSGEAPRAVPLERLDETLRSLRADFPSLSLEVYPLETAGYRRLVEAGADGLTLYQETYDRAAYAEAHPSGRKRDYGWRLGTLERGGEAGMRRLTLGALLGLHDWRSEAIAIALHADYLTRRFWRSQVAVSFPRLRHGPSGYAPPAPVSDADLVQLVLAVRLLLPDVGLVLSTREPPRFRDALVPLGITHMSAGSRTEPGGYRVPCEQGAQFDVQDRRSAAEVAAMIARAGYEPVWKDWDRLLHEGLEHADRGERQADAGR